MADYGGYETFDEFHRGALTTVWKARPKGASAGAAFAVKVCRPVEWAAEETGGGALIAAMAEAVADLRAMETAGSGRWAPVLASGQQDGDGYWVTRFFPRSLERIIEGRAQLAAEDIHWVALGVVQALAELEQRLGRPHGNLKPANVFIDGDGRVAGAPILVSDPKPRGELEAAADRTADFHALGRMIVHLARRQHANLQAAIGWPLEPGPEWRRLGAAGELWRELCTLLLNPDPTPAEQDWSVVEKRLHQIGLRRGQPRMLLAGYATLGVMVAGVIGGGVWLRFAQYETLPESLKSWAVTIGNVPERAVEVPPEWAELCGYYDNWLGEFMLYAADAKRSAEWRRHAGLYERVLAPLVSYGSFDPRDLAKVRGDLASLANQPPEAVKDGVVVDRLRTARSRVATASEAFTNWDERKRLVDLAEQFTQRGWLSPAAQLRRVLDEALLPEAKPGVPVRLSPRNVDDILNFGPAAAASGALWTELERRATVLAAGDDPVMRGLLPYLTERVASAADIVSLNRALTEATADTNRWLEWVQGANGQPRFDRAAFAREGALAKFSGPLTPGILQAWENDVRDNFAYVPAAEDPRANPEAWAALWRDVDASISSIRDEERSADPGTGEGPPLVARRDDLRARAEGLRAGPLIRRDLEPVRAQVGQVTKDLTELAAQAREAYARVSPRETEWLAAVRGAGARFGPEGSPVGREWIRRRDEVVPASTSARALDDNKRTFRELRKRYFDLERFFGELTGPRGVGALGNLAGADLADDLATALAAWAEGRTQRMVEQWLQLVRWNSGVPTETAEVFLARADVRAVAQSLSDDLRDVAQMGRDFSDVSTRIDQGFGLADPAVAGAVRWRTHALMTDLRALPAIRARLDRVTQLEHLNRDASIPELREAARSPSLGVALTAWSRLGREATWCVWENLDAELELVAGLRGQIDRVVPDDARRASMRDQVQSGSRERWRLALRAAAEEKSVGEVLARQEKFGVPDEDLAPGERFNVAVFRLKRENWAPLSPEELIVVRDQAVARLRELGGASLSAELSTRLEAISGVQLGGTKGEESDIRKLGPATVGWTGDFSADGRGVDFVRSGSAPGQPLRFVLVESESAEPFFLCTTELSVGIVLDLAADPNVRAKLRPWLLTVVDDPTNDQRMGPRAWLLQRDGRITLSSSWVGSRQPSWPRPEEAPFYPPDVPEPAPPDRGAPMHYLPPAAAQYLARDVLGSRLPTRKEWIGVVESRLQESAPDSRGPNVRDRRWLRLRDYLVEKGVVAGQFPPDADVFWSRQLGPRKAWREARAVAPDRDDQFVWFDRVDAGGDGFHHLLGNVAEYLFDPDDGPVGRFSVVGGSALSPPEIVSTEPYFVEPATAIAGFSDVGLRLAFNAPASVTGRNRLQQLIRNLPFLRF